MCTGVPTVQAPSAPHLGNCLDLKGNLYYKKLEVGDIIYNPYQKLVAKVIKWKTRLCEVKVYASYIQPSDIPALESDPLSDVHTSEWSFQDFIIHTKATRDSECIYAQVSPFSRELSHPFELNSYITDPDCTSCRKRKAKDRLTYPRGIPANGGALQSSQAWPEVPTINWPTNPIPTDYKEYTGWN